MTPAEAVADIIAKVKTIRGDTEIDEAVLGIYVEKLVNDVLDYCHRHDFPRALTFTCMDLINKRIGRQSKQQRKGRRSLKALKPVIPNLNLMWRRRFLPVF